MLTLFTGRPRSGKTYRVVQDLLTDEVQAQYVIYHNIDKLQKSFFSVPSHLIDLNDFAKEKRCQLEHLWREHIWQPICEYWEKECKKKVLIVLDDCYKYMKDREKETGHFLAMHGHYGLDIYFICQGEHLICSDYKAFVNERIHARKGKVISKFIYDHYDGPVIFRTDMRVKKKAVCDAYRSAWVHGKETYSRAVIYGLCMIVCVLFLYVYLITHIFKPAKVAEAANEPVKKIESVKVSTHERVVVEHAPLEGWCFAGLMGGSVLLQNAESGILSKCEDIRSDCVSGIAEGRKAVVLIGQKPIVIKSCRIKSSGMQMSKGDVNQ